MLESRLRFLVREHDRVGKMLAALKQNVESETSWQQVTILQLQLFMSSLTHRRFFHLLSFAASAVAQPLRRRLR